MATGPAAQPVSLPAGDLLLRPWAARDAPDVVAAAADPAIALWNPLGLDPARGERAAAEDWIRNRADWSDLQHASWAVAEAADPGRAVGSVSLFRIDPVQRCCQVGYWVAPQWRGRGVATAALRAATGFAFERLGLHRVELFHAVDNPASCRVALAAGFQQEGLHRQSYRYGDGRYHDEHGHARLAGDDQPGAIPV